MLLEELGELIQAVSKSIRGKDNCADIIEEMADVQIMLEQLAIMFEISEVGIQKVIDLKIEKIWVNIPM